MANRNPQQDCQFPYISHGNITNEIKMIEINDFKYIGNYLELFKLLERYTPAYKVETIKLFKLIFFIF